MLLRLSVYLNPAQCEARHLQVGDVDMLLVLAQPAEEVVRLVVAGGAVQGGHEVEDHAHIEQMVDPG